MKQPEFIFPVMELAEEGQRLRDEGMQKAVDHANAVSPEWSKRAVNVFQTYVSLLRSGATFKTEDVRVWANLNNRIDTPPHARAWGGIAARASKLGIIKKIGYTQTVNPKSHSATCALWEVI
jgi:hypothetical protein